MGYYGIPWFERDRRGRVNRKATLDKEFDHDGGTVIKSVMRGTTYYALWKSEKDGSYTCIVAPTHMFEGEFFYKPLTEFDGPLYYAAPRSFIDFLEQHAPIKGDDIYADGAREWRRKCLEHADELRARRKARNERKRRYKAWLASRYA